MPTAARLAAALESALDLEIALVEGHNGIYEIALDDAVMYTNQGQCSQGFPDDGKIVELIGRAIGASPRPPTAPQADLEQAPACPLPMLELPPVASPAEASSGCGCGAGDAVQTGDAACCEPDAGESAKKAGRSSGCC